MKKEKVPTLTYLEGVAREAGRQLKQAFSPLGYPYTLKTDFTPVTGIDKSINTFIVCELRRTFPHIPVQGEEGDSWPSTNQSTKYKFVVDPLDGTGSFTRGEGPCVVIIALLEDGLPILSLIYNPFHGGVMVVAEKGKGTFAGVKGTRTQILLSNYAIKKGERIVVGMVQAPLADFNLLRRAEEMQSQFCSVSFYSSMGFMIMQLLLGHIRLCVSPFNGFYETAAGLLLVEGAGGIVTDMRGYHFTRLDQSIYGHIMGHADEWRDLSPFLIKE